MANPFLEDWSEGYWMVGNTNIRTWDEDEAHMDEDLYLAIEREIGRPVVGMVDGAHYYFKPSRQVLSDECAIPSGNRGSDPTSLLVQK